MGFSLKKTFHNVTNTVSNVAHSVSHIASSPLAMIANPTMALGTLGASAAAGGGLGSLGGLVPHPASVPDVPGMTPQEMAAYNSSQGLLGQGKSILDSQGAFQGQQQGVYKQLSGLYNPDGSINQAAVNSLQQRTAQNQGGQDALNQQALQAQQDYAQGKTHVGAALQQQKDLEFNSLKQQLGTRGIDLTGDNAENATSNSSAGIQALKAFQQRYDTLEEGQQNGRIGQISAFRSNPADGSMGFLNGANAVSPSGLVPQYQNLATGYQQAAQPFTDQRHLQYQGQLQQAVNQNNNNGALLGLAGTLGGAVLGGPIGASVGGMLGRSVGGGGGAPMSASGGSMGFQPYQPNGTQGPYQYGRNG